ncbi:MAG: hypothetical protein COW08_01385 [Ignavibacteriales bacterium CG12_big_fil_rev_8_21_14_0_65_30_8]|nr:MAG: hypothetical protein COW08_01385 [Ignavibacteriales bacterium CG12_big_fil_rev_8_21_14_0_65_30_8]
MTEKEFINKWKTGISLEGIKNFPSDFFTTQDCTEYSLDEKTLMIGEEFFGKYEILDAKGNVFLQVNDYLQAKYLVYSSRNKVKKVNMPNNNSELKNMITEYEKYLDSLLIKIQNDYKKIFHSTTNLHKVTNEIFHSLNLTRY